ncbi:chemotaxis protein CheW [Alkalimonas collagenimarina]|uniref:Chemotaxis protein CheW n=1 Tax=Alkalimonas collagenimarina TaxID=400390 RepID=A0ABT9H2P3_9GAMM|nr:chemotaxis protein CheW [Alkalimonas collagenimarina]MDP4537562.1 chemotaxis protein CheW [Alkalimonas collagenimarina]
MSDRYASQKVMQHYLKALLTDDEAEQQQVAEELASQKKLESLLAQVTKPKVQQSTQTQVDTPVAQVDTPVAQVDHAARLQQAVELKQQGELKQEIQERARSAVRLEAPQIEQDVIVSRKSTRGFSAQDVSTEKEYRQGDFQALLFDVAGLTVALPLKALGGIHKLLPVNKIPRKPDWFKGVMLQREQKINVVDTARWVMPEKFDQQQAELHDYQYVIMLSNSAWGLACDKLINTMTLKQDEVKWREAAGKRPWLAGLIKQHMCALLDVDALIQLLEQGQNSSE